MAKLYRTHGSPPREYIPLTAPDPVHPNPMQLQHLYEGRNDEALEAALYRYLQVMAVECKHCGAETLQPCIHGCCVVCNADRHCKGCFGYQAAAASA